jgi:hypothetical protein
MLSFWRHQRLLMPVLGTWSQQLQMSRCSASTNWRSPRFVPRHCYFLRIHTAQSRYSHAPKLQYTILYPNDGSFPDSNPNRLLIFICFKQYIRSIKQPITRPFSRRFGGNRSWRRPWRPFPRSLGIHPLSAPKSPIKTNGSPRDITRAWNRGPET